MAVPPTPSVAPSPPDAGPANAAPPRWRRFLGAINAPFDRLAARCSRPYYLRFDAFAVWFYAGCLAAFVILSALGFHGSSLEVYDEGYHFSDRGDHALIGRYRMTRVDEWNFHTPAILDQVFKDNFLAVTHSADGPGKAALLANVPCRHFTEAFRPQFWAFHFLPAELAFSIYWQAKALLLLTGVFTLLLLLTGGASGLSAFGALWFFFSAYTQWAYSWPSLLPEMIGLFGWVMCLSFYLLVGRSRWRLALAALACATGMIDFALCAYPPQQIPLIAVGVFLTVWWLWTRWDLIFTREGAAARALALGGCFGLVTLVMIAFLLDARPVLLAAADTVYPGRRISSGGGISAASYVGDFFDFWKTEDHFPPALGNPSEGTGYFWLAPLTLLGLGRRRGGLPRDQFIALLCCWGAFLFLGAWMSLPISAKVGHWFFFDDVSTNRCWHALGLANVAIVTLSLCRPRTDGPRATVGASAGRCLGFFLIAFCALVTMNNGLANFYSLWVVGGAALYAALLALCTTESWTVALAVCLLLPGIVVTGRINPWQRHLHIITKSALFRFAHRQPEYLRSKWIIYSHWVEQPGFFSAVGLRNINSLKITPQLSDLEVFDPEGKFTAVVNQSGYVVSQLPTPQEPVGFKSPSAGIVFWSVDPLDPRLKQIGVRYAAFSVAPDPAVAAKLKLLSPAPIAGMWLYELP